MQVDQIFVHWVVEHRLVNDCASGDECDPELACRTMSVVAISSGRPPAVSLNTTHDHNIVSFSKPFYTGLGNAMISFVLWVILRKFKAKTWSPSGWN